uniref:MULE transposase domain-containing protein n=1 Tax=Lactuca sativa TaxID=4236 RepID=A0A9R1WZZ9_LACSA|nr:hypothetical protein LSAT_V11C800445480 [Lactuca sativa]
MVFETEATDQAIEPYINENVDTNDFVEATYESEELNDFGVNIEIDEDDVDDERILGKEDGKWLVDSFNDTHNHDLTMTPMKVMKHRSHSNFHRSIEGKSLMVQFGQAGLKPSQIKKAVNTLKTSNVADVTSKQCADVVSKHRKQHRGKELYGLIKHFQNKTLVDSDQYFVVDLSDDGYPRNIFWADGRSRDAYTKFRDVVVFDVTYMTNKFKMPFAPFTGVNHHGQSILFGGALLENEKEETFEWLFEHFLKCMFGKYPKAIITDQDKAIGNAIRKVFPKTRHRFCSCHIRKHETEHLRSYVSHYSDFQETHRQWVNSDTIEQFEATWTMLNELVVQYDKAVESRRAAEEDEDFKTMNSRPVLSSVHPIEAKADMMPQLSIRDPLGPVTTKGHPKLASRIKSSLEAPKKRKCSYCQGLGHYGTSCSKIKANESLQET